MVTVHGSKMLVDYGSATISIRQSSLRLKNLKNGSIKLFHVSATPGPYEHEETDTVVEQITRPTGY